MIGKHLKRPKVICTNCETATPSDEELLRTIDDTWADDHFLCDTCWEALYAAATMLRNLGKSIDRLS